MSWSDARLPDFKPAHTCGNIPTSSCFHPEWSSVCSPSLTHTRGCDKLSAGWWKTRPGCLFFILLLSNSLLLEWMEEHDLSNLHLSLSLSFSFTHYDCHWITPPSLSLFRGADGHYLWSHLHDLHNKRVLV